MGKLTEAQLHTWLREHKKSGRPLPGKADGNGLTFMITRTEAREGLGLWGLRYRHGGRQRWLPLGRGLPGRGRFPAISLKEARRLARKERVPIDEGRDPVSETKRQKAELRVAKTFKALAEDYMANTACTLKSRGEIQRYLDRDILPALGSLRIEQVTGAEIVALTRKIAKRGAHAVARRTFEYINLIFIHGTGNLLAKSNPCAGLRTSASSTRPPPRSQRWHHVRASRRTACSTSRRRSRIPAIRARRTIASFRIRRVHPKPEPEWRTLPPGAFAEAILEIRAWSARRLDVERLAAANGPRYDDEPPAVACGRSVPRGSLDVDTALP